MLEHLKAMNYPDAPTLTHGVGTVSSVVNLASGTMTLEHRDFSLGAGAFSLSVGHVYRKDWAGAYAADVSQAAGRDWKLNLEQYVLPAKGETEFDGLPVKYVYIDPLGSRHNIVEYGLQSLRVCSDTSGLGLTLELSGDQKIMTDALGNTLTFDEKGRLSAVTKRTGYDSTTLYHTETTNYTYTDGRLTSVANRWHRVDLTYDADGRLARISGDQKASGENAALEFLPCYPGENALESIPQAVGDGGAIEILPRYTESGELASITQKVGTDTELSATFHYDADARLTFACPKSPTFLRYTYASTGVEAVAEAATDAAGTLKIKRSDTLAYESAGMTSVTDDMGVTLCYYYDERGNTASILERYTDSESGMTNYSSIAPMKGHDGGLHITKTGLSQGPQINGGNVITAWVSTEKSPKSIAIRDEGALKNYTAQAKGTTNVLFSAWVNVEGYSGGKLILRLSRENPTLVGHVTFEHVDLNIEPGRTGWRYYQTVVRLSEYTMKKVGLELLNATETPGSIKIADVRLAKLPAPQTVIDDGNGNRILLADVTNLSYEINGVRFDVPIGGAHTLTQRDVEATLRDKSVAMRERGSNMYRVSYDNGKRVVPVAWKLTYYVGLTAYPIRDNTDKSQFFYTRTSDVSGKRLDKEYIVYGDDPNGRYCARHVKSAQLDSVGSAQNRYYDLLGRVALSRDEYNVDTIYSYDAYGNLLSTKLYAKGEASSKTIIYQTAYTAKGEYPMMSSDARFPGDRDVKTYYTYDDPFGVLSNVRDPDSAQNMAYDAFRKRITKTAYQNGVGGVLTENRLYYDAKDQLCGAVSAGADLGFGYDIFGKLASVDLVDRSGNAYAGAADCGENGYAESVAARTSRLATFAETKSGSQIISEAWFGGYDKLFTTMDRYRRPYRVSNGETVYDAAFALINRLSDTRDGTAATSIAKLRSAEDRLANYDYKYVYDENDMLSRYEVRTRDTGKLVHIISADNITALEYYQKAYLYTAIDNVNNTETKQNYVVSYDPNALIEPRLCKIENTQVYSDLNVIDTEYVYDELGRVSEETQTYYILANLTVDIRKKYEYRNVSQTGAHVVTTPYLSTVYDLSRVTGGNSTFTEDDKMTYTYDNDGRITNVASDAGYSAGYIYDALGRVTRFDGQQIGGREYDYDPYGNISRVRHYNYHNKYDTVLSTEKFEYTKDVLRRADNRYFKYDSYGYPTHYGVTSADTNRSGNMSWNVGQLKKYKDIAYQYDGSGRLFNEVGADGIVKRFYYDGAKLLREEWSDKRSWTYLYDAGGIVGYRYDHLGEHQLIAYQKYPDGSVKNVLVDGHIVESYSYDPYGNATVTKPTDAETVQNPIRWKGRRWDEASGFYYLDGAWYDPTVMRLVTPRSGAELFASAGAAYGLNRYLLNGNRPAEIGEEGTTCFPSMEMVPIPPAATWWDRNGWWVMLAIGAACIFLSAAVAGIGALAAGSQFSCALTSAGMAAATTFTMAVTAAATGFVTGMTMGALFAALGGGGIEDVLDAAINGALDGAAVGFMTGAIMGLFSAFQGMGSPRACFIAGTLVLTRQGKKKIEDVALGDEAWSYNEKTGEFGWNPITQTFRNTTDEWCTVKIDGEGITSTPGHKYYDPKSKAWKSAKDLKKGDKVLLCDGKYGIVQEVKIKKLDVPETTYNFEVEGFHTYFVGESGVCVHNLDCGYKVNDDMMKPHVDGTPGKSQFLSSVDANKTVLDAAKYADANNLWGVATRNINQARVLIPNGPIGIVYPSGQLTNYVMITKRVTGWIHGWPVLLPPGL